MVYIEPDKLADLDWKTQRQQEREERRCKHRKCTGETKDSMLIKVNMVASVVMLYAALYDRGLFTAPV